VPWQPRLFWTVLLPLLVLFIVLGGFYPWREICPLAAFGEVGRKLPRRTQRRVPEWLERWHLVVPFLFLGAMLVLRHVATNGDGRWISGLLIGLALAAFATNTFFTGKTWCNFICPVGVVERIYTDPSAPRRSAANAQCDRCTACKRSCPDIDQENNYWHELTERGRRIATYAFPGLVFAFYLYFWLRVGDWEAYFDGRWTRKVADLGLAFGPGFFFAPGVPAIAAAALTLAVCALVSFGFFRALEAGMKRFLPGFDRRRHLILSLASFTAFSVFYLYAGAPTLRRIPGATRAFAFAAPAIGTLVLVRRWGRRRETYARERGAARLLRNWPFEGSPPSDPVEAYARAQASEQARDQLLAGYLQTLRDVVADGLVDESEVRMLAEIRKQFGVTPSEHERALARLPEAERKLLVSGRFVTVEERLQLETYGAALVEALARSASEAEIELLRREFGVSPEDHATLVERMRSASGPLLDRARRELVEALVRRGDRETLAAVEATDDSVRLLGFLLARAEEASLGRVFDLLGTVGDRARIDALRPGLESREPETRRRAFRDLSDASPEALELSALIERFVPEAAVPAARTDDGNVRETLTRLVKDSDAFVRAAAVWSLGTMMPGAPEILEVAREDADPLVTEAAAAALVPEDDADRAARVGRFRGRTRISRMQFLRGVPLFAELEPRDLLDLAELTREEEVPPGRALCEEGRPDSGDLFVVLSGRAAVLVRGDAAGAGRETEVAQLGPGEVVGELSLIDGSPRSATVRPFGGPLRVLRIPAQAFRDRLLPRGRVSRSLLLTLTQRLRALSSRIR
jgi:cyclic nucleotide-binding protein/HEAT repeat protein/4Fe-4S binding protein